MKARHHYEKVKGTSDQYRKVESRGAIGYGIYTFYPANRTMVINK